MARASPLVHQQKHNVFQHLCSRLRSKQHDSQFISLHAVVEEFGLFCYAKNIIFIPYLAFLFQNNFENL